MSLDILEVFFDWKADYTIATFRKFECV